MQLTNPKLGDKVKVYLDDNTGELANCVTKTTIVSTIIMLDPKDLHKSWALGWKTKQFFPIQARDRINSPLNWKLDRPGMTCIPDIEEYLWCHWPTRDREFVPMIHSNGERCAGRCAQFFDYAIPNQDDGTFKCWSCRNYPFYN